MSPDEAEPGAAECGMAAAWSAVRWNFVALGLLGGAVVAGDVGLLLALAQVRLRPWYLPRPGPRWQTPSSANVLTRLGPVRLNQPNPLKDGPGLFLVWVKNEKNRVKTQKSLFRGLFTIGGGVGFFVFF